jgi:predicted alpha/beta hydrolase family esterase
MTKTLLIPDPAGLTDGHWQSWWAQIERDAEMLDWSAASDPEQYDRAALVAASIIAHPGSVLVAHGAGCQIAARALATLAIPGVAAALLVAPACRLHDKFSRLASIVQDELSVPTTVVASRSDPWIDLEQAKSLASDWGAQFVDLGDAGHIDEASGFGPWPGGIGLRDDLIVRASRYVTSSQACGVPAQRWAF